MNNKKILLITLLTLSAGALRAAENFENQDKEIIVPTISNEDSTDTLVMPSSEQDMNQIVQELEKATKEIDTVIKALSPEKQEELNRIAQQSKQKTSQTDHTLAQPSQKQDVSLANASEDNEVLLMQRFICEQEGQEEGVVCQMYECINDDCQISNPIKLTNEQKTTKDMTLPQKEFISDLTESERLTENEPTTTDLTEFKTLSTNDLTEPEKLTEKETINTNVTGNEKENSQIMFPKEENKEILTPKEQEIFTESKSKDITSSDKSITADIDVPYANNAEIRALETEIVKAERMCERAESDPREKAICEDASAKVQWKKEKIRALENANVR